MANRLLFLILFGWGVVEMLALGALVLPRSWMASIHAWLGMGELPSGPIVGYLARSTSLLYACHGALLIFASFDMQGQRRLISFLALTAILQGLIMLGVGLAESMPLWWAVGDALALVGTAAVVLALQRRAEQADSGVP
jgi:hypothetical protein